MKIFLSYVLLSSLLFSAIPTSGISPIFDGSGQVLTYKKLIQHIESNSQLLAQYMRQFAMSKSQLSAYLSTLRLEKLPTTQVLTLCSVTNSNQTVVSFVELRKGTLVWVDLNGTPVVDAQNGKLLLPYKQTYHAKTTNRGLHSGQSANKNTSASQTQGMNQQDLVSNQSQNTQNTMTNQSTTQSELNTQEDLSGEQPGILTESNQLLSNTGFFEPGTLSSSNLGGFEGLTGQPGIVANPTSLLPLSGIFEPGSFLSGGVIGGGGGLLQFLGGLSLLGGGGLFFGNHSSPNNPLANLPTNSPNPAPVPEPFSFAPLAAGLGGLLIVQLKRRERLLITKR